MDTRKELKELLKKREELHTDIQRLSVKYVEEYKDGRLIYITDHAIVRYMERILGMQLEGNTDREKIEHSNIPPENIRKLMLSKDDETEIVLRGKNFHETDNCVLVCQTLAVVTVIKKQEK
jgi:hypothetical protein